MQPESKPHTKQPPASKLRDRNTVAAALLGLKSQAKAGKLNPEHAGYAAAVGETIRIVLTSELAESDRSAELVLIMGCFRSDPKLPPSMQKMIESYIDRVNELCFVSKGNDSKLVTEWLTKMHTEGLRAGYSSANINDRLGQILAQPVLRQEPNANWLDASAIASVRNALTTVWGAHSLILLDSP